MGDATGVPGPFSGVSQPGSRGGQDPRWPRYSGTRQSDWGAHPYHPTLKGFTPDRLPPHSCHSPPIFTIPQPLGRLFRRVGQLLMSQCQLPCEYHACPPPTCSYLPNGCSAPLTPAMLPTCSAARQGRGGYGWQVPPSAWGQALQPPKFCASLRPLHSQ